MNYLNINNPFTDLKREDCMVQSMQELLTPTDCHKLMAAEGFFVVLGHDEKKPASAAMQYSGAFQRTIELWRIGYETLDREEQARCLDLLLDIVGKLGKEGYFAKQCLYTTEDNKQAAYVLFVPGHIQIAPQCLVPKRFRDLITRGFLAGDRAHYAGGRNYTPGEIGQLVEAMREYERWDRTRLAQESGADENAIARIESGEQVEPETLCAVAKALKLPHRYFFDAKTSADDDHTKASPQPPPQPEPPRSAPVEQNQHGGPKAFRQCREFLQKALRVLSPSTENKKSTELKRHFADAAKFMPVEAHDLLTVKDCQALMTADGYSSSTVYTEAAKTSADFAKQATSFKGTLWLWRKIYNGMEPEIRENLCQQLLHIVADLAKLDYVVKYSVYTTEDGKRGGVVVLCPKELNYTKPIMVPRSFSDLLAIDGNSNDAAPVTNHPKTELRLLPKEKDGRTGTYRSPLPREIRRAVKRLRQSRGWTRQQLAEATSLREYTIERIERGERVADQSLERIAKVFGLQEDTFLRKQVYIASPEEQEKEWSKAMAHTVPLPPHDITTAKDCHSILEAYGYGIESEAIPEQVEDQFQHVIGPITRWTANYLELLQPEQEEACYALLWAVRQLEAKGFIGQYVTSLTDDGVTYCVIRFVPVAEKNTKGKKVFQVPRRARKLLDSFRDREAS